MKKDTSKTIITGLIFLLLFAVLLLCLLKVDVHRVAPFPAEPKLGLSSFNEWARKLIKSNDTAYEISQILGLLALAVCICFVVVGIYQFITSKKGLKGISRGIWAVWILYALTVATYLFFDKVFVVNYRPVFEEGLKLAPSFPSSHVLLGITVYLSASDRAGKMIDNTAVATLLSIICWILALALLVARTLSGVHWATDIIGSVFLGIAYLCFYLLIAGDKK